MEKLSWFVGAIGIAVIIFAALNQSQTAAATAAGSMSWDVRDLPYQATSTGDIEVSAAGKAHIALEAYPVSIIVVSVESGNVIQQAQSSQGMTTNWNRYTPVRGPYLGLNVARQQLHTTFKSDVGDNKNLTGLIDNLLQTPNFTEAPLYGDTLIDRRGQTHMLGLEHEQSYSHWGIPLTHYQLVGNTWQSDILFDRVRVFDAALDRLDQLHVVYVPGLRDNRLVYALFDQDGMRQHVTVDGDLGLPSEYEYIHSVSIAIDNHGQPHVAYRDFGNTGNGYPSVGGAADDTVKYAAKLATGGWQITTIDTDDVGGDIQLDVDVTNDPHIVYLDAASEQYEYATIENGQLSTHAIFPADTAKYIKIAVDSQFRVHMIYKGPSTGNGISNGPLFYGIGTSEGRYERKLPYRFFLNNLLKN